MYLNEASLSICNAVTLVIMGCKSAQCEKSIFRTYLLFLLQFFTVLGYPYTGTRIFFRPYGVTI